MGCLQLTYEPILKIVSEKGHKQTLARTKNRVKRYKYKYNGKELQDELGLNVYDYDARVYDPAGGPQFWQIDPLSDETPEWSPYAYAMQNPVNMIDPDGRSAESIIDQEDPPTKQQVKDNVENALVDFLMMTPVNTITIYVTTVTREWLNLYPELGNHAINLDGTKATGFDMNRLGPNVGSPKKGTKEASATDKAQARADKLSEKPRPSEKFTKAGKEAVIDVNKAKNGGKTVCENCKTTTTKATQSKKGVTPSKKETQVDHVKSKSKGGSGTPNNGQVLCRGCNIEKSNK